MTLEEKREYLKKYRIKTLKIENIKQDRETLRALAEQSTQPIGVQRGSGGPNDRVGRIATCLVDAEKELIKEEEECKETRRRIKALIDSVADETSREILALRFLRGWTVRQVAEKMNYDDRHIRRKTKQAILRMNFDSVHKDTL